jgi:hypothetical protein
MIEIKSSPCRVARLFLSSLSVFAVHACEASAQITPVASPFTADAIETWESFPNFLSVYPLADPSTILGGVAQISNPILGCCHKLLAHYSNCVFL